MKKREGFSLIELTTVILIIAILASVSFSAMYYVMEKVKAEAVLKNSALALYHQIVNVRYYSVEKETSVFVSFTDTDVKSSTSAIFDKTLYSYLIPKEISLSVVDDSGIASVDPYIGVYFMGLLLIKSDDAYEIVHNATLTLDYVKGDTMLTKQLSVVNGLVRVIE